MLIMDDGQDNKSNSHQTECDIELLNMMQNISLLMSTTNHTDDNIDCNIDSIDSDIVQPRLDLMSKLISLDHLPLVARLAMLCIELHNDMLIYHDIYQHHIETLFNDNHSGDNVDMCHLRKQHHVICERIQHTLSQLLSDDENGDVCDTMRMVMFGGVTPSQSNGENGECHDGHVERCRVYKIVHRSLQIYHEIYLVRKFLRHVRKVMSPATIEDHQDIPSQTFRTNGKENGETAPALSHSYQNGMDDCIERLLDKQYDGIDCIIEKYNQMMNYSGEPVLDDKTGMSTDMVEYGTLLQTKMILTQITNEPEFRWKFVDELIREGHDEEDDGRGKTDKHTLHQERALQKDSQHHNQHHHNHPHRHHPKKGTLAKQLFRENSSKKKQGLIRRKGARRQHTTPQPSPAPTPPTAPSTNANVTMEMGALFDEHDDLALYYFASGKIKLVCNGYVIDVKHIDNKTTDGATWLITPDCQCCQPFNLKDVTRFIQQHSAALDDKLNTDGQTSCPISSCCPAITKHSNIEQMLQNERYRALINNTKFDCNDAVRKVCDQITQDGYMHSTHGDCDEQLMAPGDMNLPDNTNEHLSSSSSLSYTPRLMDACSAHQTSSEECLSSKPRPPPATGSKRRSGTYLRHFERKISHLLSEKGDWNNGAVWLILRNRVRDHFVQLVRATSLPKQTLDGGSGKRQLDRATNTTAAPPCPPCSPDVMLYNNN